VEPLQQRVFSVERPSYTETVLELDRQLRAHPVPELLQYRAFALEDLLLENSMVSLQRTFVAMMRESGGPTAELGSPFSSAGSADGGDDAGRRRGGRARAASC
jgi:hypothetical protein